MKKTFLPLLFVLFLSSCQQNDPLNGLWKLHIMEIQDAKSGEWTEWKKGTQGYILYDDKGNMALHLTEKGYQNTDLHFPNFTDTISLEALKYLTKSYVYFAKYTYDEESNIVEHSRISHSNPQEWNAIVQRRVSFNGDTLILSPVEEKNSGLRLKWIKY